MKLAENTYPWLRNDVVYLKVDSGVYLRSSSDSCLLKGPSTYQWLSALVPLLSGHNSLAEICDGLDEHRGDMVRSLIATLVQRRMAHALSRPKSTADDEHAMQVNYVEHFIDDSGDDSRTRFERFQEARFLVAGDGATAKAAAEGLCRNGARKVELHPLAPGGGTALVDRLADVDCLVYVAPPGGAHDLVRITAAVTAGDPAGPVLVPVIVPAAGEAFVGPVSSTGARGCWLCAQSRLYTNSAGLGTALSGELAFGVPAGSPDLSPTMAAMLGNEAAFRAFRALTGTLDPVAARSVVVQDTVTLESSESVVVPAVACRACAAAGVVDRAPVATLEDLVGERFGLFVRWSDDSVDQVPVKVGRVDIALRGSDGRPGLHSVAGFDLDDVLAARERALRSAAVLHAATAPAPRVPADVPAGARPVLAHAIVGHRGGETSGPLVAGRSLAGGEERSVPSAAVHPEIGRAHGAGFERTTLGIGVGTGWTEAAHRGLLSALALRGLERALRGEPARIVAQAAVDRWEDLRFLSRTAEHVGEPPTLLVLPGTAPAWTVVALERGTPAGSWSLGWGTTFGEAAVAAALEYVALRTSLRDTRLTRPVTVEGLHPAAFLDTAREIVPDPADVPGTLDALLGGLVTEGLAAIAVDITPTDIAEQTSTVAVRVVLEDAGRRSD